MSKQILRPGEFFGLEGALVRWGPNLWAWSDHVSAPKVRDMHPSLLYHFRRRRYPDPSGDGNFNTFVEVPLGVASKNPLFRWVCDSEYDHVPMVTSASSAPAPDGPARGKMAILVPEADWDSWDKHTVVGPTWDNVHDEEIMTKAQELCPALAAVAT